MKSYVCHYRNKYPSGMVKASENELIVHDKKGDLCVYLQKSGAGQLKDVSEEYGAEHRHDLSPIPKAARFMKLFADGVIKKAEEHDERRPYALKLEEKYGYVPSEEKLKELEKQESAKAGDGQ